MPAFFASSCSAAKPASSAAFSFSQIRGTPPHSSGGQSIRCGRSCFGSGQSVIL